MKMTKEEFRKEVKKLGYNIRFKKVDFEGRETRHVPMVTKEKIKITGVNVFTKEFYSEHQEVLALLEHNKMFPAA